VGETESTDGGTSFSFFFFFLVTRGIPSVMDLDILNRDVHLLILSQIYILKLKKNSILIFFFCGARGVHGHP